MRRTWQVVGFLAALSVSLTAQAAEAGDGQPQDVKAVEAVNPDAAPAATVPAAVAKSAGGWVVRVDAREEYRVRSSTGDGGEESDQFLRVFLAPSAVESGGRFAARAAAEMWWRASPAEPPSVGYGLAGMRDRRNPWVDVYELSAEGRDLGALKVARVGRQTAEHGQPVTFDGGYLLARLAPRLSLFAFGGRTEHFFKVDRYFEDRPLFEDWLVSAGAGVRASPDLRFEADWRMMREDVADYEGALPITDHGYGLTAWWRHGEASRLKLAVRGINDQVSNVSLLWRQVFERANAGADLSLAAQPATLKLIDELNNPMYLTLGHSLPHLRWLLDAWKAFATKAGTYAAHVGFQGRRLLDGEESAFNRNTGRLYLLGTATDLGVAGLSASASAEWTFDSDPNRGLFAVGGGVAFERGRVRAEVGTAYHRYEYRYFFDAQEIADVRVVFADVRVKLVEGLSVRARYSLEAFDRTLHTLTLGLAQAY